MQIDTLEAIRLGDATQWIRVRGVDPSKPPILLIQQGPGVPVLNEVRRFERTLALERDFTVVYWDQRGCGRSLRGAKREQRITVDQMVGDTVSLLELLATRFRQPVAIVGFSLGATIGIQATARRPDLVAKVVAVGTDVDGVAAGISAYDFALSAARERRNTRATHQLEEIGPPPHLDPHQFSTRVRWAYEFGGVTVNETYLASFRGLLASLLRSADYSIGDVVRTVRGIGTTQAALIGETAVLDLADTVPCIDVPIVMAQGRLDRVSPGSAAQRYFDALEAPSKELVWFDHSAHTPQLDEPEAFRSLLMRYLA